VAHGGWAAESGEFEGKPVAGINEVEAMTQADALRDILLRITERYVGPAQWDLPLEPQFWRTGMWRSYLGGLCCGGGGTVSPGEGRQGAQGAHGIVEGWGPRHTKHTAPLEREG